MDSTLLTAGTIALLSSIGLFYQQIRNFAARAAGFLVETHAAGDAAMLRVFVRTRCTKVGPQSLFMTSFTEHVRSEGKKRRLVFGVPTGRSFVLWRGRPLSVDWSTYYITWPRGTISRVALVRDMEAAFAAHLDRGQAGAAGGGAGRFQVVQFPPPPRRQRQGDVFNRAGQPQNASQPQAANEGAVNPRWFEDGYLPLTRDPADLGAANPKDHAFDALFYAGPDLDVVADFQTWLEAADWYRGKGLTHRRGHLWIGPPGCGKTSMARGLAQKYDLPLVLIYLSQLTASDFLCAWEEATTEFAPCIVVIEDIDGAFDGRTPVGMMAAMAEDASVIGKKMYYNGGGGISSRLECITFDLLLNTLDGAKQAEGVFTVVTTNKPEKIDEALKRPGRLDRHFTFAPRMGTDNMLAMGERIIGCRDRALRLMGSQYEPVTPAVWQLLCQEEALRDKFAAARDAITHS